VWTVSEPAGTAAAVEPLRSSMRFGQIVESRTPTITESANPGPEGSIRMANAPDCGARREVGNSGAERSQL
jgi:hypothetical protein